MELEFGNAIVSGVDSGLNELKIPDSITQKFAGFRNSDDLTWNGDHCPLCCSLAQANLFSIFIVSTVSLIDV